MKRARPVQRVLRGGRVTENRGAGGGTSAPMSLFGLLPGELVIDHFAGGGGASTGVGLAAGRSPDIAINHCPEAIRMHEVNHPETKHYISDIWEVDPIEACGGRSVGILWTSPTCTHFSKAKGTALSLESIALRALPWVTCRWAKLVAPRIICLENVEEIAKWGPLHKQHSEGCRGVLCAKNCTFGKKAKRGGKTSKQHIQGCPGVPCAKDCQIFRPIKSREGETWRAFIRRLELLGYVVEWRLLRACDYGTPTTRRRLFLIARRDGQPIVWPEPTHGPGRAQPHRTAAECIDWSDLGQSIFDDEGNTRHADKTLARLAAGVRRFVLENPKPFLVPMSYGAKDGEVCRARDVNDPMPVICGNRGSHAIVTPVMVRTDMHKSNASCTYTVEEPLRTVTSAGGLAIAAPYLIHRSNGERQGQAPRIYDAHKPLGTIVGTQKHAAAAALLIKHNGGNNDKRAKGPSAGQEVTRPLDTVSTRDTKALAAVSLLRYNTATNGNTRGQVADAPLTTVDTSRRHGIVAAHLLKFRGTSEAHIESSGMSAEQPLPAVSAQGEHMAAVAAFLVRYNGQSGPQAVNDPIGTLDTNDRYGLVTVCIDGEEYVIADIMMRMLAPRELYKAQGFPDSYVIDPEFRGKPLTRTAQIRMCGNSVPPQMAEVLARAQLWGRSAGPEMERAAA